MGTRRRTPRPLSRWDKAGLAFPVIIRYVSLAVLVGMAVAYYFTGETNPVLVVTFVTLGASAEGVEFVRDVLTGQWFAQRARELMRRELQEQDYDLKKRSDRQDYNLRKKGRRE